MRCSARTSPIEVEYGADRERPSASPRYNTNARTNFQFSSCVDDGPSGRAGAIL